MVASAASAASAAEPARLPLPTAASAAQVDRSRAYYVVDRLRHVVRVHDLDFAAYLLARDLPIVNASFSREAGMGGGGTYDFYDPDNRAFTLSTSYLNSPEARFADCVRRLKKVAHAVPPGWDPWKTPGADGRGKP